MAAASVQGGERIGEAEEGRAALLFGGDQRAQGAGVAAGLKEHRSVQAVQRGGVYGLQFGIAVQMDLRRRRFGIGVRSLSGNSES